MKRAGVWVLLAAATAGVLLASGCEAIPAGSGRFEKTLTVTGPVRLEIENGSGNTRVSPGPAGQVRVQAEFQVRAWLWQDPRQQVEEIQKDPPIEQHGNVIHIGKRDPEERHVSLRIDYVIQVPPDTELHASTGSGEVDVRGIRGPAVLRAGSGGIHAEGIGNDAEATAGSGSIHLKEVEGEADATAGSGEILLEHIRGQVRATAGSGEIQIQKPGGRVIAKTGSGDIEVHGATADVRLSASSGELTVEGNPPPRAFWELRTGSGDITLDVPENASFVFVAEGKADQIETALPLTIEEQSRRTLRGRVGKGEARVETRTSSGSIRLR